ncbi:MAG TPA: bifunctional glutamate N-acetyltransferase/amino-acid acetyltransferase ArgJ [Candidatus Hydrogenedentes bacterium]|nr:bifunctional glutamate N-acetyltransferase/amino-acid acetyltransferase ArgJ [Candidatus Hydrogenedentota bacterium]HRT21696.1 bifunctional glutamate N-acetyltransferase/amino-acid acetyltransferase ArgJ [Candidatus Hydrogenedentota bacterium]HRT66537.1 bifunctional glutamate N-acetyltransferase/amino-acid acetyltransferase ArgJ [Candidatus Hydrogenedentota bacterium]
MTTIPGGVTAAKGFQATGVAAAIKPNSTKKDCALIVSDRLATAAGTFTRNLFKAPPVRWSESVCTRGVARAIFANSGNANACTGDRGYADAQATAKMVAEGIGARSEEICVLSTGVIGLPLPMDRIAYGVRECLASLRADGSADAAAAIMTTDTVPKETAVELALSGGTVRLGAIAKGAGMIAPNMATMFCLLTTDAAIEPEPLAKILRESVEVSFNQICVDNDMSTSDSVICLANGASGTPVLQPGTDDFGRFAAALRDVCIHMAQSLVRDGEGATKFVEIAVNGASSDNDAKIIARAIATSQLCKTAFFGQDPNWGRFACAAGYSGASFIPEKLCMWIDDIQVMRDGMPAEYKEEDAAACMRKPEFRIRVEVGNGPGKTVFWTSDLSHNYVEINADYRT